MKKENLNYFKLVKKWADDRLGGLGNGYSIKDIDSNYVYIQSYLQADEDFRIPLRAFYYLFDI